MQLKNTSVRPQYIIYNLVSYTEPTYLAPPLVDIEDGRRENKTGWIEVGLIGPNIQFVRFMMIINGGVHCRSAWNICE